MDFNLWKKPFEALSNGIPLLAIPFLGDQFANAARIEKLGVGLCLDIVRLSKADLLSTVSEIIQNPK